MGIVGSKPIWSARKHSPRKLRHSTHDEIEAEQARRALIAYEEANVAIDDDNAALDAVNDDSSSVDSSSDEE